MRRPEGAGRSAGERPSRGYVTVASFVVLNSMKLPRDKSPGAGNLKEQKVSAEGFRGLGEGGKGVSHAMASQSGV